MNRIYRIYKGKSNTSCGVGYLLSEDERSYLIRVQKNENTYEKRFEKVNYRIESIYEINGDGTYCLERNNSLGNRVKVELSESCYGGCG